MTQATAGALPAAFYVVTRPMFGGSLIQPQVDGISTIVSAWAKYGDGDRAKLAYILATAFHETAQTMRPVRETLAHSDAKAKEILTKAWKTGKLKVSKDYWSSGYFGRGFVQLTHQSNYRKAGQELGIDLVGNPSLALDPQIAARILITGMLEGWFTTRKLSDFVHGGVRDFEGARRVVNGTDRATLIADHARTFLRALEADPASDRTNSPASPEPPPTGLAGVLAAILTFIVNLFRKDR